MNRPNRDLVRAILWPVGLLALLGGLLLLGRHYSQPPQEFRESVAEHDERLEDLCREHFDSPLRRPANGSWPTKDFCVVAGYGMRERSPRERQVVIREFCQRNRADLQQIPADPTARFCDEHGYLYP